MTSVVMATRRKKKPSPSDVDQAELALFDREEELREDMRRIALEREEKATMIPPMEEIQSRKTEREHQEAISRGEVANVRRAQTRSLLVLVLLIAATCAMVWWGISIMRG